MRKLAREYAFKLVFEYLFTREYDELTLLGFLEDAELTEADRNYLKEVYFGVTKDFDVMRARAEGYLENYRAERIYKTDLAALILACYEIFEREDVPAAVSVNEAVELCKKYGTEKSPAFVNGILASVVKAANGERTGGSETVDGAPEQAEAAGEGAGGAENGAEAAEASAGAVEEDVEPTGEAKIVADNSGKGAERAEEDSDAGETH